MSRVINLAIKDFLRFHLSIYVCMCVCVLENQMPLLDFFAIIKVHHLQLCSKLRHAQSITILKM